MNTLKNNTINLFFMGLFVITLITLLSFQFRDEVVGDFEESNIAKIDINDFVMYQINQNMTDMIVRGTHATQYKDKDVFLNVSLSRSLGDKGVEVINGSVVEHTKKTYTFPSGVHYKRDDGLSFFSQAGVLDTTKEVFYGKGKFNLKNDQGKLIGDDLVFENKSQEFYAKEVKGRYFMEDKASGKQQ